MKLVIPHTGELQAEDARLIRLAEFLGICCEPLRLEKQVRHHAEYIEKAVPNQSCCFVVNPRVIQDWTEDVFPADLASCLRSRFPYLLIHALTTDSFAADIIAGLSCGQLLSGHPIRDSGQTYEIASTSRDICGAFAGLSFGPINPANDLILSVGRATAAMRTLISIGGYPSMALVKHDKGEILFLASEDTADVNTEVGSAPLSDYFSRLIPQAMALRHIFGEECWHPCEAHASIIIDDPLLRRDYGYLNFETLLHLMEEYNFRTTIAFIPHNYRRSSASIVRMFRENPNHFAICFHGNDHTEAEFASTDTALLNTMLGIAEARMKVHEQTTGLCCDRVMVFPQGYFSVEAMEVLKSRSFHAAVNTIAHPMGQPVALTIADLAQPAVVRYGGFPLFLRTYVRETQSQDIAFNLFFGKPVLITEHHDVFRRPERLTEVASTINSIAPEIHWSNLESAVMNSVLRRRTPDGIFNLRAYSATVRVTNERDSIERFGVEWARAGQWPAVEQVLKDGTPYHPVEVDESGIRLSIDVNPGSSLTLSVLYRNDFADFESLSFKRKASAFVRRRLSELRDNYISKNQHLLTLANSLKRRFLN